MIVKHASSAVLETIQVSATRPSMIKDAHRHVFTYKPRRGYIYVRSRAISSRTNDNFDTFPADELRKAWSSFVGKPVFVNHNNHDHTRMRGVVIDAALHEDKAPDGTDDTWVEVLMEVDARKFPILARELIKKNIERTSMGCDVLTSECSFCGNVARVPDDYCAHVSRMKGQRLRRKAADGKMEDVLVHEVCRGLHFFENSLLVEDPADPTAYVFGLDATGILEEGGELATLAKSAAKETDMAKTAANMTSGPDSPGPDAGTRWEGVATDASGYSVVVLWRGDEAPMLSAVIGDYDRAEAWAEKCYAAGGVRITITDNQTGRVVKAASKKTAAGDTKDCKECGEDTSNHAADCSHADDDPIVNDEGPDQDRFASKTAAAEPSLVTTRSGRQVENTLTTPLDNHDTYTAVVNNIREFDGELSHNNWWGVQSDGGYVAISSEEYETLRALGSKTAGDYAQVRSPAQVETLRMQECPVCGADAQWNSDGRCNVCGYLPPPRPFQEPDTDIAGRADKSGGWFDPDLMQAAPFKPGDTTAIDPNNPAADADPEIGVPARTSAVDPVRHPVRATKGQRPHQGDPKMPQNSKSSSIAATARRQAVAATTPAPKQKTASELASENARLRATIANMRRTADVENPANPVPEPAPGAPVESTEEARNEPEAQNVDVETPGGVLPDPQSAPADVESIGGEMADEIQTGSNETTDVETPVAGTTEVDPAAVEQVQPNVDAETLGEPAFTGDWLNPGPDSVPNIGGNAAGGKESSRHAQRVALGKLVNGARDRIWASMRLASLQMQSGIATGDQIEIARQIEGSNQSLEAINAQVSTLHAVASRQPRPAPQAAPTPGRTAGRQVQRTPGLAAGSMPVVGSLQGRADDEALFEA